MKQTYTLKYISSANVRECVRRLVTAEELPDMINSLFEYYGFDEGGTVEVTVEQEQ